MTQETKTIITIALLVFAAAAWLWPVLLGMQMEIEAKKKRGDPPDYDERQKLARYRAGSHTLYVLLGFLVAWTAADQLGWFDWTGSILDMTVCALILSWGVWSADCVLHDAYATWKDKRQDIELLPLVYYWMIIFWTNPTDSGMELCDSWAPFVFACGNAVFLLGVAFYKRRKRKKAEAEETL